MIDPRELRIGNLLEYEYQTVTVDVISDSGFAVSGDELYPVEENIEDVKPIPLTPEWLERMQWTKKEEYWMSPILANIVIENYGVKDGTFYYHHENYQVELPDIELRYVHQLQNLIFCLTGKELEIKP